MLAFDLCCYWPHFKNLLFCQISAASVCMIIAAFHVCQVIMRNYYLLDAYFFSQSFRHSVNRKLRMIGGLFSGSEWNFSPKLSLPQAFSLFYFIDSIRTKL